MRLDLHCHSTRSDGSWSPAEVASRAADFGVEVFCLTDHDTVAGYEETVTTLEGRGIAVLRGMELSCKQSRCTIHLLMYGLEPGPGLEALQHKLDQVQADRRRRIVLICERLQALGHPIEHEPILAAAHGRTPGRPDVARALVDAGICNSMRQAFDRFLKDGGKADVRIESVSLAEGLELGLAAGAKMSMAHPHAVGDFAVVEAYVRDHRDRGLEGMEAYYGPYDRAHREPWIRLARKFDMVATGGSDFHGDAMPRVSRPGIEMPPRESEALRQWLSA